MKFSHIYKGTITRFFIFLHQGAAECWNPLALFQCCKKGDQLKHAYNCMYTMHVTSFANIHLSKILDHTTINRNIHLDLSG